MHYACEITKGKDLSWFTVLEVLVQDLPSWQGEHTVEETVCFMAGKLNRGRVSILMSLAGVYPRDLRSTTLQRHHGSLAHGLWWTFLFNYSVGHRISEMALCLCSSVQMCVSDIEQI